LPWITAAGVSGRVIPHELIKLALLIGHILPARLLCGDHLLEAVNGIADILRDFFGGFRRYSSGWSGVLGGG
jgi:hypothetical protein